MELMSVQQFENNIIAILGCPTHWKWRKIPKTILPVSAQLSISVEQSTFRKSSARLSLNTKSETDKAGNGGLSDCESGSTLQFGS